MVDTAHLLRLELGEVVVDRDDVDTLAGERVEVRREDADEGLALTGLHLRDVAPVERRATHDLYVEVALVQHARRRLTHRGERLRHQRVERLAVVEALPEVGGLAAQVLVGHRRVVALDGIHLASDRLKLLELTALADVQHPVEQSHPKSHFLPEGSGVLVHGSGGAREPGPRRNRVLMCQTAASTSRWITP